MAGWVNRNHINPDAISYIRIASYYAQGQTELMVNGYWGPMISWLMAPLLKLGLAPLAAARAVMACEAVVFWLACVTAFRRFALPPAVQVMGAALVAVSVVAWSVQVISPDLLVSGLVVLAVGQLVSEDWPQSRRRQVLAGVGWGLAYLAKAVALPLAVLVSAGVAGVCWACRTTSLRAALRALAVTWTVAAVIWAPWITALSLKYHRPTFSTTARIAHALVAPPEINLGEQAWFHQFRDPEPGRLTILEDPSNLPYPYWSPLASLADARHQLKVIRDNTRSIWVFLQGFDLFGLGLVGLLGALLLPRPWREELARSRWRWSVLPVLALAAIYVTTYAGAMRYYLPAYPFLWIGAAGLAHWLGTRLSSTVPNAPQVLWAALACSFALPAASQTLLASLRGCKPDPDAVQARDLAERLRAVKVSGALAGGGACGVYVAFYLNEPWHGDRADATGTEWHTVAREVKLLLVNRENAAVRELDRSAILRDLTDRLYPSAGASSQFPFKIYEVALP